MAESQRDQNAKTVILGYDASSGLPIEVAIDPATDRILCEIVAVSEDTAPTAPSALKRDENAMPIMGAYNESTGLVEPVYVDADNDGIRADVVVE